MKESYRHPFPQELVTHVTAILGDEGRVWLGQLPQLIDELSVLWAIDVEKPFPAGEYNFVAPARMVDGELAVVKIAPPFRDNEYIGEADFLQYQSGRGIVRLIRRDHNRRAILIERAIPGKNLSELFTGSEASAIRPAIDVLKSLLRQPPEGQITTTLDQWFAGMRRAANTEFPADYAAKAFAIYDRLSKQQGRTFYLHGDFHPGNIVNATRSPYLAIDPKGIIGHVGYDIAVFLNNFHWWQKSQPDVDRRLRDAVAEFSEAFGIDEREIREWAYAQMVLGSWWNFDDMPDLYDNAVAKADVWNV